MKKINTTNNYKLFEFTVENRKVNLKKASAKKLKKSMEQYGWIDSFPMAVIKNQNRSFTILDGQHRFAIAKELKIAVKYVIETESFDISTVNNATSSWKIIDYVTSFAQQGYTDYQRLLDFYERFEHITLTDSISLLLNTISYRFEEVRDGDFKIVNYERAVKIAKSYTKIVGANKDASHQNFIKVLIRCSNIEEFNLDEFVSKCEAHSHLIIRYSKMDDYKTMFDDIYNFKRHKNKIPLRFLLKDN